MLKGTLDDFTLPDMFRLMSFAKKTGRLDVDRRAGHGSVFFREGEVYYAESSLTKIPLGQKLLRAGAITESQLNKALDANAESGERVGEILLTSGIVDGEQLEAALRAQIENAVFDLLRWDLGEFSWEPEAAVEPEVGIMVSVENLIMEASRRLDELEVITRKIPSGRTVLKMADKPPEDAVEINITPEEWRILVLVDGVRTVTQIGEVVGLDEFDAMRTLYGLVSAGLIEVDSNAVAEENDEPDATAAPEPVEAPVHEEDDAVADATVDDAPEDDAGTDADEGASEMDSHEAATSEPAAAVPVHEDAGDHAGAIAESVAGTPGDDLIAEQEAAEGTSFDNTAFDAEAQAVAEAFGEAAQDPVPADDLVDQASGQLDPSELIQDPVVAGEAGTPPEDWFVDPTVPVDSFDEPVPGELATSEPPSPADSILNELLGDGSAEGQPSDRAEVEPPDAPQPQEDSAPQPPADAPRVDRAAVVRELAGLFGDEERPRSRAASPARPGEPEAPEAEDGDQRKRVEDDDQVNRGLISRLIDGVKGL